MDLFAKADMIRDALPNRIGVCVTGDCRITFTMRSPYRDFEIDAARISNDPAEVLRDILQLVVHLSWAEGKQKQKAETRRVLGLD